MPITPSFPIQNFVPIAYQGTFTGVPVSLLSTGATVTNHGEIVRQSRQSYAVNTTFDWSPAGPYVNSQAASVIIQGTGGAKTPLDVLLMVYINNADNIRDVTIYFPDTGMFVTAPAGTAGYYPVFTGGLICTVFNGYNGSPEGTFLTQQTQIIFCNFAVPGFLSQIANKTNNFISSQFQFTATGQRVILLPTISPIQSYEISFIEIICAGGTATAAGVVGFLVGITDVTLTQQGPLLRSNGGPATAAGQQIIFNTFSRTNLAGAPWVYPQPESSPVNAMELACITLVNLNLIVGVVNVAFNVQ